VQRRLPVSEDSVVESRGNQLRNIMLSQQIRTGASGSGSLLDSIDAVRNWRAVVLLLSTLVLAAVIVAVGGSLIRVSQVLPLLFTLLAIAVVFYGSNAAGMMMMDEAGGHPSRPIGAAVMSSLATSHRLVLLLLVIGVIYLLGMLAFAVLLFVCKLPGVGPLLYTLVFPVGVVVSGIAIFAVPTVIFPLSAPAIWTGASTIAGVSQLLAVARKRLLLVLLLMFGVGLVAGIVGGLIGVILFAGTSFSGILSAAVLGSDAGGLSSMAAGLTGSLMGGGGFGGGYDGGYGGGLGDSGGSYAMAVIVGGGIVYASAFTLPGLVYLRGACSVYLRAIEGLDLQAEQAALDERLSAARAKAREMQAHAQATAQQYSQRAQAPVAVAAASTSSGAMAPMAVSSPSVPGCPACGTDLVSGDAFCANCGHKLT
jgi:hypothetical protein